MASCVCVCRTILNLLTDLAPLHDGNRFIARPGCNQMRAFKQPDPLKSFCFQFHIIVNVFLPSKTRASQVKPTKVSMDSLSARATRAYATYAILLHNGRAAWKLCGVFQDVHVSRREANIMWICEANVRTMFVIITRTWRIERAAHIRAISAFNLGAGKSI